MELGGLSYFLGIEVTRDATGVTLTYSKYIHDILASANMTNCNLFGTPVNYSSQFTMSPKGDDRFDATLYRQFVGSLQYLGVTCLDLAFAISKAAQYMHAPRIIHWTYVKCILRCLSGIISLGLYICCSIDFNLYVSCDAD